MSVRGDPGFTLLEVTVTLGILSIVLAIVYGVFSQTIEGKELAERRADESAGARGALARITRDLENAVFTVTSVEAKPARRNPPPPFTTSTMQQEASRKLGFAPAVTMRLAQRLTKASRSTAKRPA